MKTKIVSRPLRAVMALALLGCAGVAGAGSLQGSLNIHLAPMFPYANSVDFHYFPGTGVYFSYRTGHYYYPAPQGWVYSRLPPPHFQVPPGGTVWVRGQGWGPPHHHPGGGHGFHGRDRDRHEHDDHHDDRDDRDYRGRGGEVFAPPQGRARDEGRERHRG